MTRVVLIAEVAERDLPSRLAIAKKIRQKSDAEIVILEQELARILPAAFYRGAIVLDKSIARNKGKIKYFDKLRRSRATIYVEDQESNAMFSNTVFYFRNRFTEDMISRVDKVFVWTKKHYETIISHIPTCSHKLLVTGSSNYSALYSEVQLKLPESYTLYNSNFSLLSNYETCLHYKNFRKNQYQADRAVEGKLEELWSKTEARFQNFCDEIRRDIINRIPIKIRHHPSETPEKLMDLLRKNGIQTDVVANKPLYRDLASARILKHISCNSRIDAALRGIPSYDIEKKRFDDPNIADDYKKNNALIKISEEIINQISNAEHSEYILPMYFLNAFALISRVHQSFIRIKNGKNSKCRDLKWVAIRMLKNDFPEIKSTKLFIVI